jgi:cyanophycinase
MRYLIALFLALAAFAPVRAAPTGNLVIVGGALRADNARVWQKIVALAGGRGARIAVFPSAAGDPARSGAQAAAHLARYGARPFVVPVAPRLPGVDSAANADNAGLAARVGAAGGAFFTGGDQSRITAVLLRADGSRTRVLDALWRLYERGGVIAGTSAGAAIMSTTMFHDPRPLPALLEEGIAEGRDVAPGLGFIGVDVFIDQHAIIRGRFARMLPVLLARRYRYGLGVDENTALVVGPQRQVTVLGYKGALLLETGGAAVEAGRAFNLADARISYLDDGDRLDLDSGVLTPGPDKRALAGFPPALRGHLFSADILGNTSVVDLMEKLVDSDQQEAIGLAFGAPGPGQALGFRFRLARVAGSAGYASTASQANSVHRLRLDVEPVRFQMPLYAPR